MKAILINTDNYVKQPKELPCYCDITSSEGIICNVTDEFGEDWEVYSPQLYILNQEYNRSVPSFSEGVTRAIKKLIDKYYSNY